MHVHGEIEEFQYSVVLDGILFYIYSSGKGVFLSEPTQSPVHNHFTYEIQYIHQGSKRISTEEGSFDLNVDEFCFINKNVYHHATSEKMAQTAFNIEIGLPKSKDANTKDCESILECLEGVGNTRVFKDKYVSALMSEYQKISEEGFAYPHIHRGMLLISTFLRVIDIVAAESGVHIQGFGKFQRSRDFERKRMVEFHVEKYYYLSNGLRELAHRLYLSEKQTGVLVKKLMGESYKRLVTKERLKVANRLMRRGSSLIEIARAVGYSSYNGFFVAYTKAFGITPEEAKARMAAGDISFEEAFFAKGGEKS